MLFRSLRPILPMTFLALLATSAAFAALSGCKQTDGNTHTDFDVTANSQMSASGAAGTTGAAGAGDAGSGAAGSTTPVGDGGTTSGCGMDPNQAPNATYVKYNLTTTGPDMDPATNAPKMRTREYWVRLPKGYDQTAPNRVIYLGPGCGGSQASGNIDIFNASGNDAILVSMIPLPEFGQCFDERANSIEFTFFDLLHKWVEAHYCVDTSRQFYAGFSTGARLGYLLGCQFPDVLRATGTIQGGLMGLPKCGAHASAGIYVADILEMGNPYQQNVMAAQSRLTQNGCTSTAAPMACGTACTPWTGMTMAPLPPTMGCVQYTGCPAADPVVFCTSNGQGHQTFEPWSDQAFWNFFKQF
jgi:poly(3-hydroxybutyrate) depolymerase